MLSHANKEEQPGWTILHHAAQYYDSDHLQKVIKTLGMKAAIFAKKYTYDTGELPVNLLYRNRYFFNQEKRFLQLLEPITVDYKIRPLSERLDHKNIQRDYPELKTTDPLYINLFNAYTVINKTRSIVKLSETHPDTNLLSKKQQNDLIDQTDKMRNECSRKLTILKTKQLQNVVDGVIQYKIGNCFEMAYFAYYELRKIDALVNAEVYEIKNGDHTFLVIGRDPASDPADFKTWGDSAVVCDAWGGYAIAAADIPKKLTCYTEYKNKNIVLPFDPNYHQLTIKFSIEKPAAKKNASLFQFFKPEDQLSLAKEDSTFSRSFFKPTGYS